MIVAIISAMGARVASQLPVRLESLTFPSERLPSGCMLSPSPTAAAAGNRIREGLWDNLPITTNPWVGTDRSIIATIRERVEGPVVAFPDGPPLSRSELSRFRLALADGVEEGYAAVYTFESRLIVAYGLRFAGTQKNVGFPNKPRLNGIRIGPIVAYLDGDRGPCSQAIGAHLRALAKQIEK